MVVNQGSSHAWNFVRAHRRPHAASADRQSSFYFFSRDCLRERNDVVWVVIAFIQLIGTELDDFMSCFAELLNQLFLKIKSTVIGGNPNSHYFSLQGLKNFQKSLYSVEVFTTGFSQPRGGDTFWSTSLGPQLPGSYS